MSEVYKKVKEFKSKYPMTVAWRLKANSKVVERHLNPDEHVIYAFTAQKSVSSLDVFSTAVIALTNKRILIGRKRLVFGYFLNSVTPEMFNDLKVMASMFWGKIYIDTVKEFITLSNIDKGALDEIETEITSYMMEAKKLYPDHENVKKRK
ncbi:MAG: PH domain-containing protein [Bacilli bacterium]|nr:PH domain-containing protein [Bacilli bacterium]